MKYEKLNYGKFEKLKSDYNYDLKGKLIVLTSISPTKTGEGKTTTLIGLTDLFNHYGKKTLGCLRQPSIGPFLGMKGGATGSGECELQNNFEINTGLTNDFEKIALVNNLIVSVIENEIYFNSDLKIDPNQIFINRCMDLNDRCLREISYNINKENSIKTSFEITAASNLMAAFCLVNNPQEFEKIISETTIALDLNKKPIKVKDLKIVNIINQILENAFLPNIVLTKFNHQILMHGGPFANIAHGCNTMIATKTALSMADYVFTECGFGSDLGLEKFINIKCRRSNFFPNLIIYAISLKSILEHGQNNLEKGILNLKQHLEIGRSFGIEPIVILNKFDNDKQSDLDVFFELCEKNKIKTMVSNLWKNGPEAKNGFELYQFILENINENPTPKFTYDLNDSIMVKINKITQEIYGVKKLIINDHVLAKINNLGKEEQTFNVCIAKDQKWIIGHKENNFNFEINDLKINYAAKLIVLISAKIFLMPGLPLIPNAKEF